MYRNVLNITKHPSINQFKTQKISVTQKTPNKTKDQLDCYILSNSLNHINNTRTYKSFENRMSINNPIIVDVKIKILKLKDILK